MGTISEDQFVSGRLHAAGAVFSGTHVTAVEQLRVSDGASPATFPGVVAFTTDPITFGHAAPIGTLGIRTTTPPTWYRKDFAGDTGWTVVGGAAPTPVPAAPLLLTPKLEVTIAPGTYNNYLPSGPAIPGGQTIDLTSTSVLGVITSGATLTGLGAVNFGAVLVITCYGPGPIGLVHESASSTAANRFNLPGDQDVTLQPEEAITLLYDYEPTSGNLRWRTMALAQASPAFPISQAVGDASDGSHTVSGTEDLAGANRQYLDLNLAAGATLITKGGLILVKGTFTLGGTLRYVSATAPNGVAGTVSSGGAGGGATWPNVYCGSGANGATGVTNGTNGQAGNGSAALTTWPCLVPGAVAGGAPGVAGSNGSGFGMGGSGGGAGAGQSGGASGPVGTNTPASMGTHHMVDQRIKGRPIAGSSTAPGNPWQCGSGGGTGGAQAGTGASGGGGAANGTIIILCTKFIDAGGSIDASGGAAGATFAGTSAGVGGSAGGGGGVIVFASFGKGQGVPANCIVTGGLGAAGTGTGKAGGNGIDGVVLKANVST